jgi:Na+-transporting NADH:ubiquinone oxidoreductase subunit NqrF
LQPVYTLHQRYTMSTADRFLVSINNDERLLYSAPGAKLIDVLAKHGIYLPSACGSTGQCGLCKVRVLETASGLTDAERKRLTPENTSPDITMEGVNDHGKSSQQTEIPDETRC